MDNGGTRIPRPTTLPPISGVHEAPRTSPPPPPRRSVPPPPPSARRAQPSLWIELSDDVSVRELSCWSSHGCAGERDSDAFYARAALAAKCRFGLNRLGKLIFVFLPGYGQLEHDLQSHSPRMTKPTLLNVPVTEMFRKMTRYPTSESK